MGFVALQEGLRRELRRRIVSGELTGTELARKTGFTQAHISNFINRKRGLKLGALDRMTRVVGLTVYDLLDPHELTRHLSLPAENKADFADVPVVGPSAALNPVIVRQQMQEVLKFRRAFLDRVRSPGVSSRKGWTRFIALQLDTTQAAAMWPKTGSRVTVLVDRYYVALKPYRPGRRNIYVLQSASGILARYVEPSNGRLLLQPRDSTLPATLAPTAATAIVGRVAQVSLKT